MSLDRVRIVPYRAEHSATFRELNAAWITTYFHLEPRDDRELSDPESYILAEGGEIFMAELDGQAIGTCALLRESNGAYELAKMAVNESARGLGVGRLLATTVISRASELGVECLELFTNSVLTPAVALYRSLGFVEAPLEHSDYGRANMRMTLSLSASAQNAGAVPPCTGTSAT